ncbi:type II secretion system protein GspL [Entomohabitans teleogrylli]|uniref:type II secretion system protein GspL n=1 Tax=Entomohabitans teleogrylli TaxID=1384589 RepID=UPI00073D4E5A|nr:type II secretion system protein GspL [Entomohabitans teleogrylli]
MKQVLFIRPDSREEGKIWWCESASQQVGALDNARALTQLTTHPLAQRVCLLLPASEMIFRHFSLPKKGLSSQATPFSWMAEETLIGDVDALHWTVLSKRGREVDAVAIAAARLSYWLTLFSDAGLHVIQALPDASLLPVAENGHTLAALDDSYWLRFAPSGACVADHALVPILLAKSPPGGVRCYGEAPPGVDVQETLPWQHPLLLAQPQWKICKANMLHGEFCARSHHGAYAKRINMALAAAALLSLGLLMGPRAAMAWMLTQQENQIQDQISQVFRHYFPSLRQQTNIKYHFGQNIKKQKKGFFLQLDELERVKQSLPAVQVNSVEYDDARGQITLSLQASTQQALQEFVDRAGQAFEFTLQPLSSQAPWTAIAIGKYK